MCVELREHQELVTLLHALEHFRVDPACSGHADIDALFGGLTELVCQRIQRKMGVEHKARLLEPGASQGAQRALIADAAFEQCVDAPHAMCRELCHRFAQGCDVFDAGRDHAVAHDEHARQRGVIRSQGGEDRTEVRCSEGIARQELRLIAYGEGTGRSLVDELRGLIEGYHLKRKILALTCPQRRKQSPEAFGLRFERECARRAGVEQNGEAVDGLRCELGARGNACDDQVSTAQRDVSAL